MFFSLLPLLLLCFLPSSGRAQQPFRPQGPPRPGQPGLPVPGGRDTVQQPPRRLDSASARRLGLPSAPKALTIATGTNIKLDWSNNPETNIKGYNIYRARDRSGLGVA